MRAPPLVPVEYPGSDGRPMGETVVPGRSPRKPWPGEPTLRTWESIFADASACHGAGAQNGRRFKVTHVHGLIKTCRCGRQAAVRPPPRSR